VICKLWRSWWWTFWLFRCWRFRRARFLVTISEWLWELLIIILNNVTQFLGYRHPVHADCVLAPGWSPVSRVSGDGESQLKLRRLIHSPLMETLQQRRYHRTIDFDGVIPRGCSRLHYCKWENHSRHKVCMKITYLHNYLDGRNITRVLRLFRVVLV
jgi:hypothetical protein